MKTRVQPKAKAKAKLEQLKVYRWLGEGVGGQREYICAAASKAEVGRLAGSHASRLFNLGETMNAEQCALANRYPGRVISQNLRTRGPWFIGTPDALDVKEKP